MILPYFAVEWVEFFGVFTDKNYLTDKNTDKIRKVYIIFLIDNGQNNR
jgi:hypothetical protein